MGDEDGEEIGGKIGIRLYQTVELELCPKGCREILNDIHQGDFLMKFYL